MNMTAFQEKWVRMSASKQMMVILTYLARKAPITISQSELETIELGSGVIQSFADGNLNLNYAPPNTRSFFLGTEVATERPACPTSDHLDTPIPPRLVDLLDQLEQQNRPLSTIDDAEMARREKVTTGAQVAAEESRVRRGTPLPITIAPPPHKA